jgi:hypothetical protein
MHTCTAASITRCVAPPRQRPPPVHATALAGGACPRACRTPAGICAAAAPTLAAPFLYFAAAAVLRQHIGHPPELHGQRQQDQLSFSREHTERSLLYTLPGGDPRIKLQMASLQQHDSSAAHQPGVDAVAADAEPQVVGGGVLEGQDVMQSQGGKGMR